MTAVLVYSGSTGYRHDSIDAGVRAVQELGEAADVAVLADDDARVFASSAMRDISAVVWMQTSGTGLLDAEQRASYEAFTRDGGGFAGVHAASDAERDWPLFDSLVGARFSSHPKELQTATIDIELPSDPSARGLPNPWVWNDEWYAFDRNPRGTVSVIASVSEATYSPGDATMGTDHPLVWRTRVGAAEAWYTALGHKPAAYDDPAFRSHLWGGISSVFRDNTQGLN